MVLAKLPVSPSWCPVASADALAVVTVGYSEWLLAKKTPCFCSRTSVGASVGFSDEGRNPSATKRTTLRLPVRASAEPQTARPVAKLATANGKTRTAARGFIGRDDTAP